MADQFGNTNDEAELLAAIAWRQAAVADGWSMRATFRNEGAETHATLEREGFKAHVMARRGEPGSPVRFRAQVLAWGPDGLCVAAGKEYDFEALRAGLATCHNCGAHPVETMRYSFAGRCCAPCLPAMRAKHERPGWAD
jgi:hypothetical protein